MRSPSAGHAASAHPERPHVHLSIPLGIVLAFFFAAGFVRDATPFALSVLLVIGAFLVVGMWRIADESIARGIRVVPVLISLAGTVAVGIVGVGLAIPPILGVCFVGTIAGALPHFVRRITPAHTAPFFVGGIVGMTSPVVLLGTEWLLVAGVLTGLIWSIAREAWIGIGGKMGLVAFAGTGIASLVALLLGNFGMTAPVDMYVAWDVPLAAAIAIIAATATHLLAYRLKWGPVLAAALTSALFILVLAPLQSLMVVPEVALGATWLGASFVGMTAPSQLRGKRWPLVVMAVTFTVLLSLFQDTISGLGGDLGATSASAVIAVIGAQWALAAGQSLLRRAKRTPQ